MQSYLSKAGKYFRLWCFYAHQKTYQGIKYVFRNGNRESDTLIVIFSGFSEMGKPPRYNYGETLRNVHYHEHIKELIDVLERHHYPMVKDNQYTYTEHAEVGVYFKSFLLKCVCQG